MTRQQLIAQLEDAMHGGEGRTLCQHLADKIITRTAQAMPEPARVMAYASTARMVGFKLTEAGAIVWDRKAAQKLIDSLKVEDGSDTL